MFLVQLGHVEKEVVPMTVEAGLPKPEGITGSSGGLIAALEA